VNRILSKILKKKKYKAEVYIMDGDFTAEYYSDELNEVLTWTLTGIAESYATSINTKSITRGIFGKICTFSTIHINSGSLKICEYKYPKPEDYLFMTDAMVYVPDSIMRAVRKELPGPFPLLK
jgi:hypothetical protein|tara:strand:- start:1616 stop:1984 length:369 start_codon:yes stop_codon:yes gene_type:complete